MPKHNLYGALVGLAVTIPTLYLLIPPFGMVGAGISASLTHLATITYQWIVFKRINKISAKELLVTKEDVKALVAEIKSVFSAAKQ
jgi:O-antigen/teichoic acid export membrane protein